VILQGTVEVRAVEISLIGCRMSENPMPFVLAYDADCGPCARFKDTVKFLDTYGRISYLALSEAESKGLLDSLPPALRFASFHLIDPEGRVSSGSNAIPKLLSLLPGGWVPSAALRMNPVASRSMRLVYTVLSSLHNSGSCSRQDANAAEKRTPLRLGSVIKLDIHVDVRPS